MNQMGADGWEFQRSETLPSIERSGLTGSTTEWRNVMVFRRMVAAPMDAFEPELLPAPVPEVSPVAPGTTAVADSTPAPVAEVAPSAAVASAVIKEDAPEADTVADAAADETTDASEEETAHTPQKAVFKPGPGATQMLPDNGVEETSEVSGMTASLRSLVATRKPKETDA
ncbi:DUF4177 domain-containing protein [Tateyamaria sp.]|uniref:DUF4177 domain-containing protein n=1 Tax=Tateyamaria sp. TaxID=1929288 RepID=UPI003B20C352